MTSTPSPPAPVPASAAICCANCGTYGAGRFCGNCGQRLDVHLHSLGHFLGEAAEALTHTDSSLWTTLWPLLARPGELTREFIAGRRARYLQPFRLYLVASVLLLVAASLESWHEGHERAAASPAAASTPAAAPARAPGAGDGDGSDADDDPLVAFKEVRSDITGVRSGECITTKADWIKPFLPALEKACHDMNADSGRELGHELTNNAGRAMFVFLPLLAAFMKLLYRRPKRYYLEHLLLLLHNHAFIYLSFTLLALITLVLPAGWIESLLVTVTVLYLLGYLYRSMRNYYGQGHALTLAKFTLLATAYAVAGAVTLTVAAFVTAVTL